MSLTVSIGLPVYNGDNYVRRAIDSVLAQTFDDFELLISDNGSTDGTEAICREYAAADERVTYIRYDENRGPTWNFNSVVGHARGRHFCWLAHDDAWAPEFLERCVAILDERPEVVLCFSDVIFVDEHDEHVDELKIRMRTSSTRADERLYDALMTWHDCLPIFGLIRREILEQTPLIGPYANGDHVLLARLALLGKYHIVTAPLFLSGRHSKQSNKLHNVWIDHHAYNAWFIAPGGRATFMPQWAVLRDYASMIVHADVGRGERIRCVKAVVRWAVRYRRLLWKDVVIAVSSRVRSPRK